MPKSSLSGRRIHIGGSIPGDVSHASKQHVEEARETVAELVRDLIGRGATFVVPVDAHPLRPADGLPITFDWLVWTTIYENLSRMRPNPSGALVIAVQHHKTEEQIPPEFQPMWDDLRASDLVQIENASHWNMAAKRMEMQARWGDILIAVGGGEGVHFLANLYHDAGKPVVPLNFPVCEEWMGARKLFGFGLTSSNAGRLFKAGGRGSHALLNRINYVSRATTQTRVSDICALLEEIDPPTAFAVRLLNPDHADNADVQAYFDTVVQPIIEGEYGYKLTVVDGVQPLASARLDDEIFRKLHRSSIAVVDLTGVRPNCFLELGYALGRGIPTVVMCRKGSDTPFDIQTISGLRWEVGKPVDERRRQFREHWHAVQGRPPLVPMEPLIP